MQIRGITKTDFDYIVSVIDSWWGGLASERAHPIFFYEFGQHALIAEENQRIVGFLLGFITSCAPATGYIHLVGIDPGRRRRGVARALYNQFTERCQKAGAARMKAISAVGNADSIRFHEALGYSVTEEADYAGRGFARITYIKDL